MADESKPAVETPSDPTAQAKAYAESARQSADDARASLSALEDLVTIIKANAPKKVEAVPAGHVVEVARPVETVVPPREAPPAETVQTVARRPQNTPGAMKACECGQPLYAHEEAAPHGCPESGCASYHMHY